jgi:hypothetical protein
MRPRRYGWLTGLSVGCCSKLPLVASAGGVTTQVTPSEIGTWILVLVCLASLAANISTVVRGGRTKTEIASQPVEVRLAERFVTKESCRAHSQRLDMVERRVDRLETQLGDDLSEIRKGLVAAQAMDEERARRIHQRIDALAIDLSEKIGLLTGQINPPRRG